MTATTENEVDIPRELDDALREAAEKAEHWNGIVEALKERIKALIGDAEYAVVDGEPIARWQHVTTRRLDQNKLHAFIDPDVLADCYTEKASRRFTVLPRADAD